MVATIIVVAAGVSVVSRSLRGGENPRHFAPCRCEVNGRCLYDMRHHEHNPALEERVRVTVTAKQRVVGEGDVGRKEAAASPSLIRLE